MKPSRVESLSDGIFAIAMTLLAFQIQVPVLPAHATTQQFVDGLHSIWAKAAVYAISFVVLGVYWVTHHLQFALIQKVNLRFLWLNIAFLLLIGFVPFSAALLGAYSHEQVAILIYGTNLALCSFALYAIWEYASYKDNLIEKGRVSDKAKRNANIRILGAPFFYIAGILISFIDPRWSLFFFVIPPVFSFLPARIRRRMTT